MGARLRAGRRGYPGHGTRRPGGGAATAARRRATQTVWAAEALRMLNFPSRTELIRHDQTGVDKMLQNAPKLIYLRNPPPRRESRGYVSLLQAEGISGSDQPLISV